MIRPKQTSQHSTASSSTSAGGKRTSWPTWRWSVSPDAAVPVAAQIEALRELEKTVRAEREEILARREAWELAQQHLSDLEAWCRTVAERLTELSVAEKRLALEALGVQVRVRRAGCTP
jgi:hypothetical protein